MYSLVISILYTDSYVDILPKRTITQDYYQYGVPGRIKICSLTPLSKEVISMTKALVIQFREEPYYDGIMVHSLSN